MGPVMLVGAAAAGAHGDADVELSPPSLRHLVRRLEHFPDRVLEALVQREGHLGSRKGAAADTSVSEAGGRRRGERSLLRDGEADRRAFCTTWLRSSLFAPLTYTVHLCV